jgi:hypothetical protein
MLGFQRFNEFVCLGKELRAGYGEFLSQSVRNLIDGTAILQELPDSESDWVETETDTLFNIQEHRPIFGGSLPDAWCDREVCDRCWLAHVAALGQSCSVLSGNTGHNSVGFWTTAKSISVARICAAGNLDEMLPRGL